MMELWVFHQPPGDDVATAGVGEPVDPEPAAGTVVGQRGEVVVILEGARPDLVRFLRDLPIMLRGGVLEHIAHESVAIDIVGAGRHDDVALVLAPGFLDVVGESISVSSATC